LQQAVADMRPDDVVFELDVTGDRLRVRMRAYRNNRR
jgi:hypothetical protein